MFRRKRALHPWDLRSPLLDLNGNPWTVDDATMGTHIFGAVGSGKTTTSGQFIARSFLRSGFGGLVLCAKADEAARWEMYLHTEGRIEDHRIVRAHDGHRFNVLNHELEIGGSLVQLLVEILELTEGKQAHDKNPFWERASAELVRNSAPLFTLAGETITLTKLLTLVRDAPRDLQQEASAAWKQSSFCAQLLIRAAKGVRTAVDRQDYELAKSYWLRRYPQDDERTRSNILATFTGTIDQLVHGVPWQLLSTDTTLTPEAALSGAVIVLDLPVTRPGEGRLIQLIWKHAMQRAVLRRSLDGLIRPVFIFCDEAHEFASPFDARYQSECRQHGGCTVYLSQNVSTYQAKLGGAEEADALLGNFRTLIFHANRGPTNQWAADAIAQEMQAVGGYSVTPEQQRQHGPTVTQNQQLLHKVQPAEFTELGFGEAIVTLPRPSQKTGNAYTRAIFTR